MSHDHPAVLDRLLTIDQLRTLPPLEPLVDGLLDLDSFALLYGRRGSFKSFLALDIGMSVAAGTRWHGRPVRQGAVVYLCAEGASGFPQRIDAWETEHPTVTAGDRLRFLPEAVNLLSPSSVGEFADACAQLGVVLVIVDTLSRCLVGGDENGSKDAGLGVEQLDVIRRRTGACVLVVHHAGKDADKGGRGSSVFEAAADSVYAIQSDSDAVTLTCTKQKNHAEPLPIQFAAANVRDSIVLRPGHAASSRLPRAVRKTLQALADIDTGSGVSATSWKLSSEVPEASFYRHRKDLVTLGLVSNVGTDKQPRYQVSDAGTLTLSEELS